MAMKPCNADCQYEDFLERVVAQLEKYQDGDHWPLPDEDNKGLAKRMTDAMVEATGLEFTAENAVKVAAVVQAFVDQAEG